MAALRLAALALCAHSAFADALADFQPPVTGTYAATSDMYPAQSVDNATECATWCLSEPSCISFNLCQNGTSFACGIESWNISYVPASSTGCSWYRRIIPRNDTFIAQAVPWQLSVPTQGVTLAPGPFADAFNSNLFYLRSRDPLDMLYFFAIRAGVQSPPGQCYGWGGWIHGSEAGNYLMGAGGAIRWIDDPMLRNNTQQVVDGIANYSAPNGWAFAFTEAEIVADNLPDYCAGWVVRGLIDADGAGLPGALDTARATIDVFNNHTLLPFFLPQNGGPNPVLPYPSGFNNVTNGGYGQATGHMIYIEYQGMIKHTLLALTRLGKQADVDIIEDLYQEDWWLQALLAMDPFHAIWHRQFFSHNYEVTAYEAFLDMYVLTGNVTYLNAVMNAWTMLRQHWILPGGSMAINEGSYYPPDSYYIGFTGRNVASAHAHGDHSAESDDPYYHAPCMPQPMDGDASMLALKSAAMTNDAAMPADPNSGDPPTGELCGSVFWTKLNQRFHRLNPENETFVWEMERSIINVASPRSARRARADRVPTHSWKQYPSSHASCCEGQGTRLFGSLPEYVYTYTYVPVPRVYVDLYAASSISLPWPNQGSNVVMNLTTVTAWPYGPNVTVLVSLPSSGTLDVALRMPAWVASASIVVLVNGAVFSTGKPGSYLHVTMSWPAGVSTITFALPMALQAIAYSGSSQIPPYLRYAYTYGPVLLAAESPSWNDSMGVLIPLPNGASPAVPNTWMLPAGDGNSLHFAVAGSNGSIIFKPYFEIQAAQEQFTVYPCFDNTTIAVETAHLAASMAQHV